MAKYEVYVQTKMEQHFVVAVTPNGLRFRHSMLAWYPPTQFDTIEGARNVRDMAAKESCLPAHIRLVGSAPFEYVE